MNERSHYSSLMGSIWRGVFLRDNNNPVIASLVLSLMSFFIYLFSFFLYVFFNLCFSLLCLCFLHCFLAFLLGCWWFVSRSANWGTTILFILLFLSTVWVLCKYQVIMFTTQHIQSYINYFHLVSLHPSCTWYSFPCSHLILPPLMNSVLVPLQEPPPQWGLCWSQGHYGSGCLFLSSHRASVVESLARSQ